MREQLFNQLLPSLPYTLRPFCRDHHNGENVYFHFERIDYPENNNWSFKFAQKETKLNTLSYQDFLQDVSNRIGKESFPEDFQFSLENPNKTQEKNE